MKTREIRCDYSLDLDMPMPRQHRWNKWLVMKSPAWVQKILHRWFPRWYSENLMFYILAEEIQKEINNEILTELTKVLKDGLHSKDENQKDSSSKD